MFWQTSTVYLFKNWFLGCCDIYIYIYLSFFLGGFFCSGIYQRRSRGDLPVLYRHPVSFFFVCREYVTSIYFVKFVYSKLLNYFVVIKLLFVFFLFFFSFCKFWTNLQWCFDKLHGPRLGPRLGTDTPGPGEAVFAIRFIGKPQMLMKTWEVGSWKKNKKYNKSSLAPFWWGWIRNGLCVPCF